jgi:hypothetical protein
MPASSPMLRISRYQTSGRIGADPGTQPGGPTGTDEVVTGAQRWTSVG